MYGIHEGDVACGTLNHADQRFAALPDQKFLVIDVFDVSDPHALLTYAPDALLAAYGPFDGERRVRAVRR